MAKDDKDRSQRLFRDFAALEVEKLSLQGELAALPLDTIIPKELEQRREAIAGAMEKLRGEFFVRVICMARVLLIWDLRFCPTL
jgi:hypothetical protein